MPEGAARPDPDIERLLCLYQQGDTPAAAQLVRTVSPMFVRFCIRQGDSPQDLEDILQEIWMRVHQARHTYRPGAAAAPWLYAVARNARLDAWRRRERFRSREIQVQELPEPAATIPPTAPGRISEMLEVLPAGQREALLLLKGCGMSLEEIAGATCSTVGAVKQKVHRAYKTLRIALAGGARGRQS
jgi:RNA polymerase sigma-70 factor (ECF subfamily)